MHKMAWHSHLINLRINGASWPVKIHSQPGQYQYHHQMPNYANGVTMTYDYDYDYINDCDYVYVCCKVQYSN